MFLCDSVANQSFAYIPRFNVALPETRKIFSIYWYVASTTSANATVIPSSTNPSRGKFKRVGHVATPANTLHIGNMYLPFRQFVILF